MNRTNTAKWNESKKQWRIDVQRDGLRRSFYSSKPGRTGQREANAKADAWLAAGATAVRSGRRCDSWLDEYLEHVRVSTSMTNYKHVLSKVNYRIRPEIGRIKAEALTEAHLQRVLDRAAADGLAKKTQIDLRTIMSQFCKYLRKAGASSLHPEDLTIASTAATAERHILQPQALLTLFSSEETVWRGKPHDDPYIHAYRFAVLTGLRPGELAGLRWDDITGATVRISRAINYLGEETHGKNENARRSFVLSDLALVELQAQRQISEGPSVFGILTQAAYRSAWYRYCEHNGLPHTTPYELRHTFVSVVQSLPEAEVKRLVGHSRNMDTFGTYGHELDGQREQIATHVQEVFRSLLAAGK